MGRRKQPKLPTPPEVLPTPVAPVQQTDLINVEDYQQKAMSDDMTMASTVLTKPKRKKLKDDETLMGSY